MNRLIKKIIAYVLITPMLLAMASGHAATPKKQHKVVPSNGTSSDFFGFSVAIHGNTALVGAYKVDDEKNGVDAGSAYVFTRSQSGWYQQEKLTASDGAAGDSFGGNVAIFGHTSVVGAIKHDQFGMDSGAAYVFSRTGPKWTQSLKLTADDGSAGDAFGQSLAVSQDTLAIGAPHDDDHGASSGSVYLFKYISDTWQQWAKITAPDGAEGDVFGISLALDGDTLLVGADLNDEQNIDAGAVYVYVQEKGAWNLQAKLMAADAGHTDIFGVRVALSGDTALISARRDDDDSMGVDAGSAYVFTRDGTHWKQQAKLTATDGAADDRFGRGVALVGDTALISAMHQNDQGNNSGAAYVFTRNGNTWRQQEKVLAKEGTAEDVFGWSIAMTGNTLLIGAPRHDEQGNDSGAAYLIEMDKK